MGYKPSVCWLFLGVFQATYKASEKWFYG